MNIATHQLIKWAKQLKPIETTNKLVPILYETIKLVLGEIDVLTHQTHLSPTEYSNRYMFYCGKLYAVKALYTSLLTLDSKTNMTNERN